MTELTNTHREIVKRFEKVSNMIPAGMSTMTGKDLERSYSWSPITDVRFVSDAVMRLGDGTTYNDTTAARILESYENWVVEMIEDDPEWRVDAEEDRLVRAWLKADPFIHFLYGYVLTEELADAARDYACYIVTGEGAPEYNKIVDRVAGKFLAVWKETL